MINRGEVHNPPNKIFVFKTSVKKQKEINLLKPFLDASTGTLCWNFDLEDCDNILRVESEKEIGEEIVNIFRNLEFSCEELKD